MKRVVLLKMSGEAIAGTDGGVFSMESLHGFSDQVVSALRDDEDLRVAVVVGGGNILRGKELSALGFERNRSDHMGMLATIVNALALQDSFIKSGCEVRVMTGFGVPNVAEPFIYARSVKHLSLRRVLIFAGGTGQPYFTTDTAAALRAIEIHADELLIAKYGTDGAYDKDPRLHVDALMHKHLTFDQALSLNLGVMDATAVSLCRDHNMPIRVFGMDKPENAVYATLMGESGLGTTIGQAPE